MGSEKEQGVFGNLPSAIAVDGKGLVCVAAEMRVQIGTRDGVVLREFGHEDCFDPNGLALTKDEIMVAATYNHRILVCLYCYAVFHIMSRCSITTVSFCANISVAAPRAISEIFVTLKM